PTALMVGTGRGAQLGILIRGPQVLESTRAVDTIVLDKTGTVTTGQMSVIDTHVAGDQSESRLHRHPAAIQSLSEHPIARAITALDDASTALSITDFVNHPGSGLSATIDGTTVLAGKPAWLRASGIQIDTVDTVGTQVAVAADGAWLGTITVADTVKDSSAQAITQLRKLKLEPILLTGDNDRVARNVANRIGIENIQAGVTPAGKLETV